MEVTINNLPQLSFKVDTFFASIKTFYYVFDI